MQPGPELDRRAAAEQALTEREVELIRGTYDVLLRSGAHQLSLRTVAKELGVSAPLLVYHFGSRENLLLETVRWALRRRMARIEALLRGAAGPWAILDELLPAGASECREWFLFYVDLAQHAARHPSFRALGDLLHQHLDAAFLLLVRRGVEAGLFLAGDLPAAARRARALVEGALLRWLQDEAWEAAYSRVRDECRASLETLLGA